MKLPVLVLELRGVLEWVFIRGAVFKKFLPWSIIPPLDGLLTDADVHYYKNIYTYTSDWYQYFSST